MAPNSNDNDDPMPYVYLRSRQHAWVPGRVLKSDGKTATVVVQKYKDEGEMILNTPKTSGITVREETVALKDYENGVLPMQNVDDRGKLGDHEDMVNLPYLHEAAILYNIKNRHIKGKPYTRTGDMIVALNPYQWIDSLYTEKQRELYANRLVWESSENDPRDYLHPHVYETSALAYKGMAFEGRNQSILVSGESGAGKTETVKICMNHIASVQEGPQGFSGSSSRSRDSSLVVQRVLDSNPLLEAFGNAKTRRNDNSSRFGKYTQLQFGNSGEIGRPVSKLAGSKSEVYLLEKNRVVSHVSEERTFHIFYQLLAAPEDTKSKIWSGLAGTKNESFKYVGATTCDKIEGVTDGDQFQRTLEILKLVGLPEQRITRFLRAICAVLQIGNVSFVANNGDEDSSAISSSGELKKLSQLMDIPEADLELALTERTMKTRNETYKVPLTADMARDSADALAKEIYGKLFLWLVDVINVATSAENNQAVGKDTQFGIVGLLDIFGFESFTENRFEQLCINYANEKLQQKFTEDIFKAVQAEYKMEGIPLADIKYDDNTDVLDLIEGPTGLCALLNEECVRPKGSGSGFVNKALAENRRSPCLVANKTDRLSFAIHHYAGKVFYDADQFVTSNMDTLPTDLQDCITKCSNAIIANAFQDDDETLEMSAASRKATPKRGRSNLMAPTVWTKYKGQLSHLMVNLRATDSRYIRCIKPNKEKKPLLLEHTTTVEQLRCAGIVAGVTISRSAFPNRLPNAVVYARYNNMWEKRKFPSTKSQSMSTQERIKADCEAVMSCALQTKELMENGKLVKAFVVGKTRTYFRAGALEFLESQRITGLDAQACAIQKAARGWLVRKDLIQSARIKQELTEQALREKRERQERLKREKEERDAKFQRDMDAYSLEIAALRNQLKQDDEKTKAAVAKATKRAEEALDERDELERKTNELIESGIVAKKKEMERLQVKLESNIQLVRFLRKENKRARKSLMKDESLMNDESDRHRLLADRNNESCTLFGEFQEDGQTVLSKHDQLQEKWREAKDENTRLKEQLRKEQGKYMDVAEQRLEFQKTMARILNAIQDTCKDQNLVEHAFYLGHECETEAKCLIASIEATEPGLVPCDESDSSGMSLEAEDDPSRPPVRT